MEDFDNDPPLTPVHYRYLEEFDLMLRAGGLEARELYRGRMRLLVALMRLDNPRA